ncbi:MAG: hypothetical protein AB1640_01950 [bacterium]
MIETALKYKLAAFACIGAASLGRIFREELGAVPDPLWNGILLVLLALGLFFWIRSRQPRCGPQDVHADEPDGR